MIEIDKYFDTPIEFLTYQLKQQFDNFSDNELKLLCIVYLKGLNPEIKKEIVKWNIFKSLQSVENHLSKFRKEGILKENVVNLKTPLDRGSETTIKLNLKLRASTTNS